MRPIRSSTFRHLMMSLLPIVTVVGLSMLLMVPAAQADWCSANYCDNPCDRCQNRACCVGCLCPPGGGGGSIEWQINDFFAKADPNQPVFVTLDELLDPAGCEAESQTPDEEDPEAEKADETEEVDDSKDQLPVGCTGDKSADDSPFGSGGPFSACSGTDAT